MSPKILMACLFLAFAASAHQISLSVPKGTRYKEYNVEYSVPSALPGLTYDAGLGFSDREVPLRMFNDSLQGTALLRLGASYWVPLHPALHLGAKARLLVGILEMEQPLYGASGGLFARVRPGRLFVDAGLDWTGIFIPRILQGYFFREELVVNSLQNTGLVLTLGFEF
jgi:hypothetical protein